MRCLEAHVCIFLQIWTMLPGFCTCPVDLLASFKGIARVLGMAINERADLRLIVCQALRTIINKSCSAGKRTRMFTEKDDSLFLHLNQVIPKTISCPLLCLQRKKRPKWVASPRTSCPSSSTCTASSLQLESPAPTGWLYWTPLRST